MNADWWAAPAELRPPDTVLCQITMRPSKVGPFLQHHNSTGQPVPHKLALSEQTCTRL